MVPIQPLLAYMAIEGLRWTVRAVCRARKKKATARMLTGAACIFTAFMVAFNIPRVLRHAVWYNYLSHTPLYYEFMKVGRHAEQFRVADMLGRLVPPGESFICTGKDVRVLHYLTRRRAVGITLRTQDTRDAECVLAFIESVPVNKLIALDIKDGWGEYQMVFLPALGESPRLEPLYRGQRWHLYRRIQPKSRSR